MDLRPLGLGELVDRSATVWRAQWLPLFRLFVGFQLVQYVFLRVFELAARAWFPLLRGGRAMNEALQQDPTAVLRQAAYAAPAILALMLIIVLMIHANATAGAAYVVPLLYGREASVGGAVRHTWRRAGAILGLGGLSIVWSVGWGLLCLLPLGVLAGIALAAKNQAVALVMLALGLIWLVPAMIALALGWVLRFATAGSVLAMEEVTALGAYRRSGLLSSGRVGEGLMGLVKIRLTLVITVVSAILLVVGLVAGMPALIIQTSYGHLFDPTQADPDAVPQALLIPAQLFQVIAGSLVSPLYAVTMGWFYVDMRMRREGLDLELKLGGKA